MKKTTHLNVNLIHEIISQQAFKNPYKTSVFTENRSLTYSELEIFSNQLSNYLLSIGVRQGDIIAIAIERSIEFIIGILGILKSGATYVPLNPFYPINRLKLILKDCQPKFILVQEYNKNQIMNSSYPLDKLIIFEKFMHELSHISMENNKIKINNNSLAYILYTSGSTGDPKGVMVEHEQISNYAVSIIERLSLPPGSSFGLVSTTSADLGNTSIYGSLCSGGTLNIFDAQMSFDGELFARYMEKSHTDCLKIVPSHLEALLDTKYAYKILPRKCLILGGEVTRWGLVEKIKALSPELRIINHYGPTETTVGVLTYEYDIKYSTLSSKSMPIGKPLKNINAYILGKNLKPKRPGMIGEIYIGGKGVSRGYLNNPSLTKEKFINLPFLSSAQKFYKTGDLGRYLSDGNIEFIGRADSQVKIHGYRIELTEIEHILKTHGDVKQAVVLLLENDKNKQKYIVAYIVAGEFKPSVEEIKSFLSQYLMDYMIPSFIMFVEKIPLTSNGKIDSKSLSSPFFDQTHSSSEYKPKTEIQKKLMKIWCDLLQIQTIPIDKSFFELGGNSLLAIQMLNKIYNILDVHLSIKYLAENKNIAQMGNYIENIIIKNKNDNSFQKISIVEDKAHRFEEFPLTDIQRAYWLGRSGLIELGKVSVHGYSEYDFRELDLSRLEKAWNLLIKRHEALRIVFTETGSQRILKNVPVYKIKTLDLRKRKAKEARSLLSLIRNRMSHQVHAAEKWPLFEIRATLLKNKVRLHVSRDILILDAWSTNILFTEWSQLYNDLNYPLPPISISFRDYVFAEKELKKTDKYYEDRSYWLARTQSFPSHPLLPLVKLPKEVEKPNFRRLTERISSLNWNNLKMRALEFNLTPTIIIASAFAEVLALWSKKQHFAINLTLFNRYPFHEQINNIIGDFTSILFLECDYRHIGDSFLTRTKKLQNQLWQDLDHRLYSGVEFLSELNSKGGSSEITSRMPVVLTCILDISENKVQQHHSFTQLMTDPLYSISQTPQVWLDFKLYNTNDTLVIEWDFVEELFPKNLIEDMHKQFCNFLIKLSESKEIYHQNIIDLLPEDQRFSKKNEVIWPLKETLLHQLFLNQVKKNKKRIAVITSQSTLSYQDLDFYSSKLANLLKGYGPTSNKLIAIILEKGFEQVISVLSVLKAGAAYVPLDPSLPIQRINKLLEITAPIILICKEAFKNKLMQSSWVQNLDPCRLIFIDSKKTQHILSEISSEYSGVNNNFQDLAYVIFTSGSTGEPKGVMLTHSAVANTILDIIDRYEINEQDKILALSDLSFDLSVFDIFGVLAAGGTVVIPDQSLIKDPQHWIDLINKHKVTIWNSVPTFLEMLTEYVNDKTTQNVFSKKLRLILLSGDWISLKLPEKTRTLFGNPKIISLGGATEGGIWSIEYVINHVKSKWKSIPYGKPLRNQNFYILNERLQECPTWVTGELYISGKSLAKGYWKDEKKTLERFIIHPFLNIPIYKTGDLGRYFPDGNIEFLGREDQQVKLAGYRIELAEIDAYLKIHQSVKESVTLLYSIGNTSQLVSFVVLKSNNFVNKHEKTDKNEEDNIKLILLKFLSKHLPIHMIPKAIVFIENIPFTSNGKIDRNFISSLYAPKKEEKTIEPPRNRTEKIIVNIFKKLLENLSLGIHDNLFELGGSSITAINLLIQLRKKFNKDLVIKNIFENPTPALLAKTIDAPKNNKNSLTRNNTSLKNLNLPINYRSYEIVNKNQESLETLSANSEKLNFPCVLPIETKGNKLPLFCIHPIGGNVHWYWELSKELYEDQALYGLENISWAESFKGELTIEELATCYINNIKKIQQHGPYHIAGWSFGGVVAFEVAKQLQQNGEIVAPLIIFDHLLRKGLELQVESGKLAPEKIEIFIKEKMLSKSHFNESQWIKFCKKLTQIHPDLINPCYLDIYKSNLSYSKHNSCAYMLNSKLLSNYKPTGKINKIILYLSEETFNQNKKNISNLDSNFGWSNHSDKKIDCHIIQGNHYSILNKPDVHFISKNLKTGHLLTHSTMGVLIKR